MVGHNNNCNVGYINSAPLTHKGILVNGTIGDSRVVADLCNQYIIYYKNYTTKITHEQYFQNIFSSISLSHNPVTLDINHVGLVNIPGRIGTGITFKLEDGKSRQYNTDLDTVRNCNTAQCVAFLRYPCRTTTLNRNSRNSYNTSANYITASSKYHQDNNAVMDPSDQFLLKIGREVMKNKLLRGKTRENLLVDGLIDTFMAERNSGINTAPPPSSKRKREDDEEQQPSTSKQLKTSEDHQSPSEAEIGTMIDDRINKLSTDLDNKFERFKSKLSSTILSPASSSAAEQIPLQLVWPG